MVSKRTIFQEMAKSSRWFGAVGAGYLVVAAFLVGYILAAELKPDIGTTAHVTCGILSAAPIAVAFIWERLRSVKVLGVEIALSEYSAGLLPLGENRLVDAVASKQYFSDSPEILRKVREAVLVPGRQILEINLRSEPYWWSTRLFLEAALLDDYSQVRHVVIVEGYDERRYVGMTTPQLLRAGLAESEPCFETIYRQLKQEVDEIESLIDRWSQSDFEGRIEIDAKSYVNGERLHALLGERLDTTAVHRVGREGPLLHYKVIYRGSRFVPVAYNGRLEQVVNADDLARSWALACLENALK